MFHRLSIVVVALTCTTTLAAQVVAKGTRTPGTTSISIQPAPATGEMILQKLPPLAVPSNLRASGTTQAISLSWSAAAGATGYRVWRLPVGGMESLLTPSPITATSIQDTGPFAAYGEYAYRVTAVHPTGESAPAQVTFLPPPPAPPPVSITHESTGRDGCIFLVTARWAPVAGATEYVLTIWDKGNFIRLINFVQTLQYEERQHQVRLANTQLSHVHSTGIYPKHTYEFSISAVFPPGNVMSLPSTPVTFTKPSYMPC